MTCISSFTPHKVTFDISLFLIDRCFFQETPFGWGKGFGESSYISRLGQICPFALFKTKTTNRFVCLVWCLIFKLPFWPRFTVTGKFTVKHSCVYFYRTMTNEVKVVISFFFFFKERLLRECSHWQLSTWNWSEQSGELFTAFVIHTALSFCWPSVPWLLSTRIWTMWWAPLLEEMIINGFNRRSPHMVCLSQRMRRHA